jgi:membrane peptidoglycan carboxypeptidase
VQARFGLAALIYDGRVVVTTVDQQPDVPARRPGPRRLWWRRFGYVVLGGLTAVLVGFGGLVMFTPSVDDAPQRAARLASAEAAGPALTALPSRLATAVVAVEDHRFYQHPGLDVLALTRFAAGAVRGRDAGAATIDAQLAKVLYTGGRQNWLAQLERVGLAVKLDRAYSKRELLLMYLGCVYFGHGFTGATAAARGYFGRDPDQLDWPQAALLAGILQAPNADDPLRHPEQALTRRDYALRRLGAVGVLTPAQVAAYQKAGLGLRA